MATTKTKSALTKSTQVLNLSVEQQQLLRDTLTKKGVTLPDNAFDSIVPIRVGADLGALVATIPDAVVIADFYLPYRFASNCPPVQFVLPPPRPIFTLLPECQGTDEKSVVRFNFTRRTSPCEVQVDDKPYESLVDDQIKLDPGNHKIVVRDAEGGISLPQNIEIFKRFSLELPPKLTCNEANTSYTATVTVVDARLPLFLFDQNGENGTELEALPVEDIPNKRTVILGPFNSGETVNVQIGDSSLVCPPQPLTFSRTCVPLQVQPDTVATEYNTAVIIDVLANDVGNDLTITAATVDSIKGAVVITADQKLQFTPNSAVRNEDVVIDYTVQDGNNISQSSTATVHVKCGLPCEGKTLRRGHAFALPPLFVEGLEAKFIIEFPQGTIIDLSVQAFELARTSDNSAFFFAQQISQLVFQHTGSANWLTIDPNPRPPEFGNLFVDAAIEYYECLNFELTYKYISSNTLTPNVISISPQNTHLEIDSLDASTTNLTIPAYNPIQTDKCNPNLPPIETCANAVDLTLDIKVDFVSNNENSITLKLSAVPTGTSLPVAYLWEVASGHPFIFHGESNDVTFFNIDLTQTHVRLTAFTDKGCRIVLDKIIDVNIG